MSPRALVRNVTAWPAAGASSTIRSQTPGSLELLHLAEHEDLADAGNGRRHHVEHAGRDEAFGDPAHAVLLQIFQKSIVRRQHSPAHTTAAAPSGRCGS